jgi:hypothetical protein
MGFFFAPEWHVNHYNRLVVWTFNGHLILCMEGIIWLCSPPQAFKKQHLFVGCLINCAAKNSEYYAVRYQKLASRFHAFRKLSSRFRAFRKLSSRFRAFKLLGDCQSVACTAIYHILQATTGNMLMQKSELYASSRAVAHKARFRLRVELHSPNCDM